MKQAEKTVCDDCGLPIWFDLQPPARWRDENFWSWCMDNPVYEGHHPERKTQQYRHWENTRVHRKGPFL